MTHTQTVQVPDEPPAGWEWNDDSTLWQQMLPVPAGWFDSGWNWQRRDDTPSGWEDFGDEFAWRRLVTAPMDDDGYEHTPARDGWRRLVPKPGWDLTAGRWRHLAPTPVGYVVDDVSYVITVPARQRHVPLDAPEGADTSTVPVIHPAPVQAPGADVLGEWDTDAGLATDDDGTVDLAAGAAANVQPDGTVVYDTGSDAGSVAGQVLSDGSVRLAVTIPDAGAPRSFAVPMTMPNFMAPALQDDGSVLVMALLQKDDPATAVVEEEIWEVEYAMAAPWAKDANGNDVKTWYGLDGRTLTQTIEPTAATVWPVVADPTAKQHKQAAVAREQSKIAQDQAVIARKARDAAREAQEKAAKKAAVAQAKLLKAQSDAANRKQLAAEAKKKAEAAKKQMQIAKEQAGIAAKAAKEASKAADKAKGAAKKLADSNAKKLAKQADEDAKAAVKATTRATNRQDAAKRASDEAAALKEQVDDAAVTAKIVVDAYAATGKTTKQKIKATQGVLDKYATRVKERIEKATQGTTARKKPDAGTTAVKNIDPTMAERMASLSVTVDNGAFSADLGGKTERARMRFVFTNTSTNTAIPGFSFTAYAPLAEAPSIGARIYSAKAKDLPLIGADTYGCVANYQSTATCSTVGLVPGASLTIQLDLIANPALTEDYTSYQYAGVRPELRFAFPYGARSMTMPVNLLRNKYQQELDRNGRVDVFVPGWSDGKTIETDTVYHVYARSNDASDAKEVAEALQSQARWLDACGFGTPDTEFERNLQKATYASVPFDVAAGAIEKVEKARREAKGTLQGAAQTTGDAATRLERMQTAFPKAVKTFGYALAAVDGFIDLKRMFGSTDARYTCAPIVDGVELGATAFVPIVGPLAVMAAEWAGAAYRDLTGSKVDQLLNAIRSNACYRGANLGQGRSAYRGDALTGTFSIIPERTDYRSLAQTVPELYAYRVKCR